MFATQMEMQCLLTSKTKEERVNIMPNKNKEPWVYCDGEQVPTMNFWFEQSCAQRRSIDRARTLAVAALVLSALAATTSFVLLAITLIAP